MTGAGGVSHAATRGTKWSCQQPSDANMCFIGASCIVIASQRQGEIPRQAGCIEGSRDSALCRVDATQAGCARFPALVEAPVCPSGAPGESCALPQKRLRCRSCHVDSGQKSPWLFSSIPDECCHVHVPLQQGGQHKEVGQRQADCCVFPVGLHADDRDHNAGWKGSQPCAALFQGLLCWRTGIQPRGNVPLSSRLACRRKGVSTSVHTDTGQPSDLQ